MDAELIHGISINIQGTPEKPLFQANQIGSMLGLVNISDAIKDFDEDEKCHQGNYTLGGRQNMLFLTELGLYRLLGASRKLCTRPFQKWVARVVTEIRQVEQRLDLSVQALEANRQENQLLLEASNVASTKAIGKARHDVLVACNDRVNCVYVIVVQIMSPTSYILKIGETGDLRTRMKSLKTQYRMATLLDVFVSSNAHTLEQDILHVPIFRELKYDGSVNGHKGAELFIVDGEHTYKDFYQPLIRKKFEDHKRIVASFEERRLCFEERRLCLLATLLETTPEADRIDAMAQFHLVLDGGIQETIIDDDQTDPDSVQAPPVPVPYNRHRQSDMRVQQYDATDLTQLIATHEGTREAARAIIHGKESRIRAACMTHVAYLGYRWFHINRAEPTHARSIPPTAMPNYRSGRVAQLTLDSSSIVAIHYDQIRAAEAVGLKTSSSITTAMNRGSTAAGHRWVMYEECDEGLRSAFEGGQQDEEHIQDTIVHGRGKIVQQMHPIKDEVVATHASMIAVCRDFQASHKQIHKASQEGIVYKGFKWKVI